MVEGAKMSKSKGNFFTARDLFAKGVTPAALRLELVRTHYRTNANFTLQGLADCQRQVDRWTRACEALAAAAAGRMADFRCEPGPFERGLADFTAALCDDLNVASAIAALNTATSGTQGDACPVRELAALHRMDSVLGVLERNRPIGGSDDAFAAKVETLLEARRAARSAKAWAESDRIRDELLALGVAIKDGPQGTTWTRTLSTG
jgi:cysteinyl-tRNA synthetase